MYTHTYTCLDIPKHMKSIHLYLTRFCSSFYPNVAYLVTRLFVQTYFLMKFIKVFMVGLKNRDGGRAEGPSFGARRAAPPPPNFFAHGTWIHWRWLVTGANFGTSSSVLSSPTILRLLLKWLTKTIKLNVRENSHFYDTSAQTVSGWASAS